MWAATRGNESRQSQSQPAAGRGWSRVDAGVEEHHAVSHEYTTTAHFWISTNVPILVNAPISALEHVHEILVKDQNALTENDVTSDRLDAERILVVNLQQSCFFPVPKF